ncbi:hypothetical protein H9Q13_09590 [Pontibacter sp. JH31]|uniref:DUF6970 domain-containing protein n=1 Tax=Pontibacter aquaedesilientis TaxID=2766980 RepID=A0ABR7XGJ4_9BACT|nr:hypothetical protein [Pontibacter aquaedesilientis]MBD1397417.1 hypothetical protein [Pontibacter aquaedesilientis]
MAVLKYTAWLMALLLLMAMESCQTTDTTVPDVAGEKASEQAKPQPTAWLSEMIRGLKEDSVANPPAKVYRYTYNEQEVYYLTGRCCDIPSKVYDVDGNLLCEPDGGITGKGDGRCPDFLDTRTNETLIWEDKREAN